MYSLCPNVRNDTFKLSRYAGATIMETPKSAAAVSATASAMKISANKYVSSL